MSEKCMFRISSFNNRPSSSPGTCLRIGSAVPLVRRDWFLSYSLRSCSNHTATKLSGGVDGRALQITEVREPETNTSYLLAVDRDEATNSSAYAPPPQPSRPALKMLLIS
jgi:hypothetical protein